MKLLSTLIPLYLYWIILPFCLPSWPFSSVPHSSITKKSHFIDTNFASQASAYLFIFFLSIPTASLFKCQYLSVCQDHQWFKKCGTVCWVCVYQHGNLNTRRKVVVAASCCGNDILGGQTTFTNLSLLSVLVYANRESKYQVMLTFPKKKDFDSLVYC